MTPKVQAQCGKIRARKTAYTDTFHAVIDLRSVQNSFSIPVYCITADKVDLHLPLLNQQQYKKKRNRKKLL